jgi:hypothetical protein
VAWNTVARLSDACLAATGKYVNIFNDDEAPAFTLTAQGGGTFAATTYVVRNYYGVIVASGNISGSSITLSVLPLGWYKLYLVRPTDAAAPWLQAGGETLFVVCRSGTSLAARPAAGTSRVGTGGDPQVQGTDIPARAFTGFGPYRHTIRIYDDTWWSSDIDGAVADTDYTNTWWATDPVRGGPHQFANVDQSLTPTPTTTNLNRIVDAMTALVPHGCVQFETWNEPNAAGATVANTISQISAIADSVHTVSGALLMAPASLAINDSQLNWVQQVLVGLGSKVDVISFHDYSGGAGDLPEARRVWDNFVAMLTSIGMDTLPRQNTEAGTGFSAVYGSFEPRAQSQWAMLEMHLHEQYAVPKERYSYFYDRMHGFWGFPSGWIQNEMGEPHPGPLVALVRVWSEELFGKAYTAKLDFGTVENNQFLGCRFVGSDGSAVLTLQSAGRAGNVALSVSGASSLAVVSPWGATSTATVTGGLATVAVDTLPIYVRLPAGATAVPEIVDYGTEVARAQGSVASASSGSPVTPASRALDGLYNPLDSEYQAATTEGTPAWWQVDFPASTRFDRVVIHCPIFWQNGSTLLDFDIQVWNGTGWTTVATDTEPTNTIQWTSFKACGACFTDSFFSRRNVFHFKLDTAVETTAMRVYARDVTYGGGATVDTTNGAGLSGGALTGQTGPRRLTLREVLVYLSSGTGGGGGVGRGTPMLIQPRP